MVNKEVIRKRINKLDEYLLIGFRNTLMHEYTEIDRKIVYQVLQEDLVDIEALIQVFAQFL